MKGAYEHPDTRVDGRSLTVGEIMSSPVVTAKESSHIKEIAKLMGKHRIDAVVITDRLNEPIGMVTGGDIVRKLVSRTRNLMFSKAKHIMSVPVKTIKREMKLEEAARYMATHRIKKLCVVDEDNKVAGILTSSDITKNASYLIDVLEEIIETGYVAGETSEDER